MTTVLKSPDPLCSYHGFSVGEGQLPGSSLGRIQGVPFRMNGVGERGRVKEREKDRKRETRLGVCSRVLQIFIFYCSFYILSKYIFKGRIV